MADTQLITISNISNTTTTQHLKTYQVMPDNSLRTLRESSSSNWFPYNIERKTSMAALDLTHLTDNIKKQRIGLFIVKGCMQWD